MVRPVLGSVDGNPATVQSFAAPGDAAQPLQLVNLLNDVAAMRQLLLHELSACAWLDVFLLAAGINQAVEDWLHREIPLLGTLSRKLAYVPGRPGAVSVAGGRWARELGTHTRATAPRERRVGQWQLRFSGFVQRLADRVAAEGVGGGTETLESGCALQAAGEALLAELPLFPAVLQRSVLRLPTCFRSLDLHPLDCRQLIMRFAAREPQRDRPLLVVGVRTSGSYLAPLYAAYLKHAGYRNLELLTIRPRQSLLAHAKHMLDAAIRAHALVLLADDPPNSGVAFTSVAAALADRGVPRQSIVPLVMLLGPANSLPGQLESFRSVVLPGDQWHIQARLKPEHVRSDLEDLLRGATVTLDGSAAAPGTVRLSGVTAVERLPLTSLQDLQAGSPVRRHVRALFRATLVDEATGSHVEHHVYVKGAGLGYLGRHALAVGEPLAVFFPDQYGMLHGLLYREWLDEDRRLTAAALEDGGAPTVERVADYAATRRRELSVPEDLSQRLAGETPAWERVARLFSLAFRNVKPTLVEVLATLAARRLLRVAQPSIVDGSMAPSQWFAPAGSRQRGLLKVDYDERAFSNQDTATDQLYCYDAAFDVAAAMAAIELEAEPRPAEFGHQLLVQYEARAGEQIGAERLFLYQWLHVESYLQFVQEELFPGVFSRRRSQLAEVDTVHPHSLASSLEQGRRAQARFSQEYYRARMLADLEPASLGPLCGIDLDGVLETLWLGFMAITPAAVRSLRGLTCHGFRPVLVTGRSVGDVRERCSAYRLAGGVAEYGASVYNHQTRQVRDLLSAGQRQELDELRALLRALPGVYIDPAYRSAVRAYRFVAPAKRRALTPEVIDEALTRIGLTERVRAIGGVRQTDFMTTAVDKASGLRTLAEELGADMSAEKFLAMAAGDTLSDMPMLNLARWAFAPGNADSELADRGVPLMRGHFQSGLEQGVSRLLGHRPGTCPICAVPSAPPPAALLLTILGAQDTGALGSLWQAALVSQILRAGARTH